MTSRKHCLWGTIDSGYIGTKKYWRLRKYACCAVSHTAENSIPVTLLLLITVDAERLER